MCDADRDQEGGLDRDQEGGSQGCGSDGLVRRAWLAVSVRSTRPGSVIFLVPYDDRGRISRLPCPIEGFRADNEVGRLSPLPTLSCSSQEQRSRRCTRSDPVAVSVER